MIILFTDLPLRTTDTFFLSPCSTESKSLDSRSVFPTLMVLSVVRVSPSFSAPLPDSPLPPTLAWSPLRSSGGVTGRTSEERKGKFDISN